MRSRRQKLKQGLKCFTDKLITINEFFIGYYAVVPRSVVRQACEELGLDCSQLPGSRSRV
jgi:hypothetical protein